MVLMTRMTQGIDAMMPGRPGGVGGHPGGAGRWPARRGTRPEPGPGTRRMGMRVLVSEQSKTEAVSSVIDLIDLK